MRAGRVAFASVDVLWRGWGGGGTGGGEKGGEVCGFVTRCGARVDDVAVGGLWVEEVCGEAGRFVLEDEVAFAVGWVGGEGLCEG